MFKTVHLFYILFFYFLVKCQNYLHSDDKEGCVESIQWLRGRNKDISTEYEEMTDTLMWGNSIRAKKGNGFINEVLEKQGACGLMLKNISKFER